MTKLIRKKILEALDLLKELGYETVTVGKDAEAIVEKGIRVTLFWALSQLEEATSMEKKFSPDDWTVHGLHGSVLDAQITQKSDLQA